MDQQQYRRLRREFVRRHHPDVGGDQVEFIVGLRALELTMLRDADPLPRVVVVPRRAWPRRMLQVGLRAVTRRSRPPRVR